ncbi:hypothetical protein CMV_010170 [Castanea mollissima]|uniref:Uncharacterized protein n=1 Tax=Castanea mollissima TaxID=60419 RepID=A0A8J4VQ87_9ROSI|nr:hypothetical protein CMV_010170 [Castanea mollissima]
MLHLKHPKTSDFSLVAASRCLFKNKPSWINGKVPLQFSHIQKYTPRDSRVENYHTLWDDTHEERVIGLERETKAAVKSEEQNSRQDTAGAMPNALPQSSGWHGYMYLHLWRRPDARVIAAISEEEAKVCGANASVYFVMGVMSGC